MFKRGPGQGQGKGLKQKTPGHGPLTGAGRGIEAGARQFWGPGGPITNTNLTHGHQYHQDPKFHVGRKGVVGT